MIPATSTKTLVHVVIVNYYAQDLIVRCIESLARVVHTSYVITVVDNSEEPDSDRLEQAFPGIEIVRSGKNLGFAGGCNVGIEKALEDGSPYVLLLNPDTVAESDFITPMVSVMEVQPGLGIVGPKILNDDEIRSTWQGGSKLVWALGGPRQIKDDSLDETGDVKDMPAISGCAMCIRTQAVREVGLMDEDYFLYFEDTDYCRKLIDSGWRIGYIPSAKLLHAASTTTGFQSSNYLYYFSRNRLRFMKRWSPKKGYLFYLVYHLLIKVPGAILIFGLTRRKPSLSKAFIKGTIAGLAGKYGPAPPSD